MPSARRRRTDPERTDPEAQARLRMEHLSEQVGRACTRWLQGRGLAVGPQWWRGDARREGGRPE